MITLCGGCGNSILACTCKPQELAKPVGKGEIPLGVWHNGIRVTRGCPVTDHEPLVTSPIMLPDILETAVYGKKYHPTPPAGFWYCNGCSFTP